MVRITYAAREVVVLDMWSSGAAVFAFPPCLTRVALFGTANKTAIDLTGQRLTDRSAKKLDASYNRRLLARRVKDFGSDSRSRGATVAATSSACLRVSAWVAGIVIALGLAAAPAMGRARAPAVSALVSAPLAVPAGEGASPFEVPRRLLIPRGWRAQVWARVAGARFGVWAPGGSLLISVPATGEVVLLQPRRDRVAAPRFRVLLSGLSSPEGLGFGVLGGRPVLFVAESDQLDRYTWPGLGRTVLVRDLPDPDGLDRLKGLAVGPDSTVDVGVGSDSRLRGPRGVVLAVGVHGQERIAARGIHDAEGLAYDPGGHLWAAINSAGTGDDEVASLQSGRPSRLRPLPPHTAPLGLAFLAGGPLPAPWRRGALLAVHGALDPAAATRPGVLWLPWDAGSLGPPDVLVAGFQNGRARWGRPTDALVGPDGSLYVVDDLAGAVYRLVPDSPGVGLSPGGS